MPKGEADLEHSMKCVTLMKEDDKYASCASFCTPICTILESLPIERALLAFFAPNRFSKYSVNGTASEIQIYIYPSLAVYRAVLGKQQYY